MNIAQSLYEGVDLGNEGAEGLITYMRTDSVRVAPEAIDEARSISSRTYGKEFLPPQPKRLSITKKRPRCPRSHPPDQPAASAGKDPAISHSRSIYALSADLEALYRFANDARHL